MEEIQASPGDFEIIVIDLLITISPGARGSVPLGANSKMIQILHYLEAR